MTAYPNISELLKDKIPDSPPLYATIYKGVDVGQIWGQRFTIWNVLLYDSNAAFKAVLQELDALVAKHKSAYGEDRLRNGINNDPFSFLSELVVYDNFRSFGISPEIEPQAAPGSSKKMDLSVNLDGREILIEVKMPHPPAHLIMQGTGFAPLDFDLSKKLAGEIDQHLDIAAEPTNPTIIMINGLYSALDPFIVGNSIEQLNNLKEDDFPEEPPDRAKLLAERARLFVSAVLLFRSDWEPYMAINTTGLKLSEKEILSLKKIFQIQS